MRLLQMSFSGAVFITAAVLIRSVTVRRLPKRTFLILWELALIRLLVPFSVPSIFSVYTLLKTAAPGTESVYYILPAHGQPPAAPSVSVAGIVWCAGMVLSALFFTVAYVRCLMEFRTALPVENSEVERWQSLHPLRRPVAVRQSDRISAPLTYGIFRPVILLPKKTDWQNERQLQYILAHEYAHIMGFDAARKLAAALALCVHWFNPFVFLMYSLFNRDLELACDERVVRQFGEQSKAVYSLMLIDMEETKSRLSPFCSSFSKNVMEERITAIMKTKKITVFSLVLAGLIVAGTATVFATSAADGNRLSPEERDRMLNTEAEAAYGEETMLSYVDTRDGKTYYSVDGGETFEPLTDAEFEERFLVPDVEWWTCEEYEEWLEEEKIRLQSMLGEQGWTGGRGEFVWTQEVIDETVAVYEDILQDIKNGMMVSKRVDNDADMQIMYNPKDVELGTSEKHGA